MGCVYKINKCKYWYIRYYRDGKAYVESSRSTIKADARRLLARREGSIADGKFEGLRPLKTTVNELLDFLIKNVELRELKSLNDQRRYVALLREYFGPVKAAYLGTEQILDYRLKRKSGELKLGVRGEKENVSDSTINLELGTLKRAFTLGTKHEPPLVIRVPNIEDIPVNNIRQGFLEYEDFLCLRAVLPDYLQIMITIGYFTGMRAGEVRNMQWRQIDLTNGMLRLEPGTTKNKRGRNVPMVPELKEVLERWWMESMSKYPDCPWVIHHNGRKNVSHYKAWEKATEKVGLKGLIFHDLRRSAVRNLSRAGIPMTIAMQISGHRTDAVYRRYDIPVDQDLIDAKDKLSNYLQVQAKTIKKPLKLVSEGVEGDKDDSL